VHQPADPPPLSRALTILMATAVAVIVANIYYIQPLLNAIAHTFGLTVPRAGALAMLSQAGTATGMLFFVPLGDKFERRSLIVLFIAGAVVSLLLMALAPNVLSFAIAAFLLGAFAANVHVVVPFAAHLAAPWQRGRVVGTIVAGILIGVLLARTFSGNLGAWLGWRAVYFTAAGAMLLLAPILWRYLPQSQPEHPITWLELMRSTAGLVRRYPLLRESALLGGLLFAGFSAFWTTLVFLVSAPPYSYSSPSAAAGLFGLVGAAGALAAPTVGHLADKHGPRFAIRIALWLTLASFLLMALVGKHLPGLIAGVILMDLGVQSGHVSNQTRIYAIDPAARSRLNTVYMFTYFIGGGLGSLLGALAWHRAGWPGVCAIGAIATFLSLVVEFTHSRHDAAPIRS
jgi:predicted MFS family arabinose efflux permease